MIDNIQLENIDFEIRKINIAITEDIDPEIKDISHKLRLIEYLQSGRIIYGNDKINGDDLFLKYYEKLSQADLNYKEKQLRDEKLLLLNKEKQLRDKELLLLNREKQLRDEKLLLLNKEKQVRDEQLQLQKNELNEFVNVESFSMHQMLINNPAERLAQISKSKLNQEMIDNLMYNNSFVSEKVALQNGSFQPRGAFRLISNLSNIVKTQTQFNLASGDLLFDGLITNNGQISTTLQYVAYRSRICCAKIGTPAIIDREVNISNLIHNSIEGRKCCVMPVLHVVSISNGRKAMISPFYPRSVSHFIGSLVIKDKLQLLADIALSGIASIKEFHRIQYCHGDIKPDNLMLSAEDDNVVFLIDFGSAVPYGESLTSFTPDYGLNVDLTGSLFYDLTCLATTLMRLHSFDFLFETKSILQFRDKCKSTDHFLSKIALELTEENLSLSDKQNKCIEIVREYRLKVAID